MKITKKFLGIGLAAVVGFACSVKADDSGVGKKKQSLEQRISQLESQLKDAGVGQGVKGSGIKVSGYVDTSYLVNLADWKNTGPVAGSSFRDEGRVFDNQADAFNINAFKLTIQKDKDTSKFPAGFRFDGIYGSDATVLNNLNGPQVATGFNENTFFLEQAYVDLGIPVGNGIDVKFGKMVSPIGYEVLESPANWQFSRSDAFRLAPVTQLGAQFAYQFNDIVTLTSGVINGLDSAAYGTGPATATGASNTAAPTGGAGHFNRSLGYVGRVDLTFPKTSVGNFTAFVDGYYGHDNIGANAPAGTFGSALNNQDTYIWNTGGLWDKPFDVKALALGLDYLYRNDGVVIPGTLNSARIDASTITGYAKWDWSQYLTSSARFGASWYKNANVIPGVTGAPPAGPTGVVSLGALSDPTTGFYPHTTDMLSFTLTQAFNVWKDTLVRLEWRRDWTDTPNAGFGNNRAAGSTGSDDLRSWQDTIAVNVVYSF